MEVEESGQKSQSPGGSIYSKFPAELFASQFSVSVARRLNLLEIYRNKIETKMKFVSVARRLNLLEIAESKKLAVIMLSQSPGGSIYSK